MWRCCCGKMDVDVVDGLLLILINRANYTIIISLGTTRAHISFRQFTLSWVAAISSRWSNLITESPTRWTCAISLPCHFTRLTTAAVVAVKPCGGGWARSDARGAYGITYMWIIYSLCGGFVAFLAYQLRDHHTGNLQIKSKVGESPLFEPNREQRILNV